MKKTVIIYSEVMEGIRELTNEQAGALLRAACAWADDQPMKVDSPVVKPLWAVWQARLEKYECSKGR